MTGELSNLFITLDLATAIQVIVLGFYRRGVERVYRERGGFFYDPGHDESGCQWGGGRGQQHHP